MDITLYINIGFGVVLFLGLLFGFIKGSFKTVFSQAQDNKEFVNFPNLRKVKTLNRICIVACGTAMHAGLAVKPVLENLCKIPVDVDVHI